MNPVDEQVLPEIVVEVRGGIADDLAEYIREKVTDALTRTRRPVPRVHVRVVKHGDPAREKGVTAHANVDLDGRPLLAHAAAATPPWTPPRAEGRPRSGRRRAGDRPARHEQSRPAVGGRGRRRDG